MADDDNIVPPPKPKLDYSSPYYLGPQDRPGNFLTPNRLRENNYDDWAIDIQTALKAHCKFCFLNGTITVLHPLAPPTTGLLYRPC